MDAQPLLSLRLTVDYPGKPGVLRNLALDIGTQEILGLVGQSGCGKSTLALAILKLLYLKRGQAQGSIQFNGRDLMALSEREVRSLRGKEIGLILQSPMSSLNPALRIGTQLEEAWKVHRRGSRDECQTAQRVLIAMAILHRPALLIADEPTSALDLITQAEILQLFASLSSKFGISILYISHDLLSVATIAHRVAVMNDGEIVECRKTAELFQSPKHPYTRQLIRALPVIPQLAAATVGG